MGMQIWTEKKSHLQTPDADVHFTLTLLTVTFLTCQDLMTDTITSNLNYVTDTDTYEQLSCWE